MALQQIKQQADGKDVPLLTSEQQTLGRAIEQAQKGIEGIDGIEGKGIDQLSSDQLRLQSEVEAQSSLSSELHGKIEADNQKMAGIDSSIQKDLGSIKDLADQYNGSNAFFYALDSSTTFIGDIFGQQEAGHHLMRSFEGKTPGEISNIIKADSTILQKLDAEIDARGWLQKLRLFKKQKTKVLIILIRVKFFLRLMCRNMKHCKQNKRKPLPLISKLMT